MTTIHEIAPDIYRISLFVPEINLQFNQFLVNDEQPLLYHTGTRGMFARVHEAVSRVIDPAQIRWISASHFELDEWGALNEWLEAAPHAQATSSVLAALLNLNDFASRPPRGMDKEEVLTTGKYRFRFHPTPHLPHGWDAGVLFEETRKTLFCSDLFHHFGNVAPVTSSDLIDPARKAMRQMQQGPLAGYIPYTRETEGVLKSLAGLKPETLAVMHGSSYVGQGDRLLTGLASVINENFDQA